MECFKAKHLTERLPVLTTADCQAAAPRANGTCRVMWRMMMAVYAITLVLGETIKGTARRMKLDAMLTRQDRKGTYNVTGAFK
jgi:hypothetical protein